MQDPIESSRGESVGGLYGEVKAAAAAPFGVCIRDEPPCALDWFSLLLLHPGSSLPRKKMRRSEVGPGLQDADEGEGCSDTGRASGMHCPPSLAQHAPALVAIQKPGDIVFVPHGTWHCVLNLGDSVAYTRNFINAVNLRAALAELQDADPHMHHDLAAWASKMRFS